MTPISIPGYHPTEIAYQGEQTAVFRGTRTGDGQPVIIKLLRTARPDFHQLVQLRNQYEISRDLNHPAIARSLALERYRNGYALIMADSGAIALSDYWPQRDRSLSEFAIVAVQLAEALHYLNQQRIIHKDIKPSNIIIHPATARVQLIDFSISTLLTKEQHIPNSNSLEGTLDYISPEQTGRMNRGIDYRTDLYSLGVTFFELLMGELPFLSNDPMELVHCHMAKIPLPMSDRLVGHSSGVQEDIPIVLSDIVMKLMAKNPEDRYQSALGLKYDLEQCWEQWSDRRAIERFTVGQRDRCDRFIISDKLYGRDEPIQQLLDAFARTATPGDSKQTELVLVTGFSGIGKTATIKEIHQPIVRQQGYFIQGQFNRLNRNIPFSAFVQAFQDLVRQLLGESDEQLVLWKAKILDAVGEQGQVAIDVIPDLERIIGPQPNIPQLSDSAAQHRFNLLFCQLIGAIASPEHPIVLFLDNLQRADLASLKLLEQFINRPSIQHLLILGAYRDNEIYPTHPLSLLLDQMGKDCPQVSTIHLQALDRQSVNHWIADTLLCSAEMASPLSDLVYQKTQGNPFFAAQFLKGLYEDGWITFASDAIHPGNSLGVWQCDLTQVRQLALTNDVVTFMVERLQKLPEATQDILKIAACLGDSFNLETLSIAIAKDKETIALELWPALTEEFIIPESTTYKFFQRSEHFVEVGKRNLCQIDLDKARVSYRFLHDRVRQAAYFLICDRHKKNTHLTIGRRLLEQIRDRQLDELDAIIVDAVNQMNLGSDAPIDRYEKHYLAQLNCRAGEQAKAGTGYLAALGYAEIGISLLPANPWQHDYQLTLDLYNLSAEAAYLAGNNSTSEAAIALILQYGNNILDKLKAYQTKIKILIGNNQFIKAIELGLKILDYLGVDLPLDPENAEIKTALDRLNQKLQYYPMDVLLNFRPMTSPTQLGAMRILSSLLNAAYLGRPKLLPLLVAKQVELSITYGNTSISPSAYANYGLILCGVVEDIERGKRFGRLAIDLLDTVESQEFAARTIEIACLGIKHWKEPIKSTLKPLLKSYQIGLTSGDLESSAFAAYDYCAHLLVVGENLETLARTMSDYSSKIRELQQPTVFHLNELHRQTVLMLLQEEHNSCQLKGDAYDEEQMLPIHQASNDVSSLALFYIDKLFLCYLLGDRQQAIACGREAESYLEGIAGQVFVPIFHWYDALSWLALYSQLDPSEQATAIDRIEFHESKLAKWARFAPMNYMHKFDLIRAEKCRILRRNTEAIDFYDRAIAGAKANQYIQDESLANELAARFYLDWGKEKIAMAYIQEAYQGYQQWGASAIVSRLEIDYFILLHPILDRCQPTPNTSNPPSTSTTQVPSELDLASALKASRAISEEIELDTLLSKLMQIIVENAGADRGILILNNGGTWEMAALCNQGICNRLTTTLDRHTIIPTSIINTVKRTQRTILIDSLDEDTRFTGDPYFQQQHPQSLCCTPVLNQRQPIGILYLENHCTTRAFSPERLEVLNLLTAQAAISIENATLYKKIEYYAQTLEAQVEERTQELAQANATLYRLANLDGLTQVANRRSFDRYLQDEWQRSQRTRQPISLVLCDVDYFKQYNDCYGHQAGDRILQQLARALEQSVNHQPSLVARYGGEEFAIVLPKTDRHGAVTTAARIRKSINELKLTHQNSLVGKTITVSMGVHSIIPSNEQSWEQLIQIADFALYQAKQQGRDRYCYAASTSKPILYYA
ncbi:diguanylate cyclase domain-containing protein [Roseofilum casamattae]|uniref:Diguanylate cyclase n=1 Tax=Roseofilum casamattae BLCC-M143 TaxID=3022442 RepID=A0ABT7BZH7_9CYAN|nr:diguanylate cyclase [Roseofilum casamattae]MDJ1184600.1 diguanylate cyclase [Roseofilum casamattae BLCC-M143]